MQYLLLVFLSFTTCLAHLSQYTSSQAPGPDGCCNIPSWTDCPPVSSAYSPALCDNDFPRSGIPCSTRQTLMRQALQLGLNSPPSACPFGNVFAAIVGVHTGPNVADFKVLCTGVNNFMVDSFLGHGEIEAIKNCTNIIRSTLGPSYVTNQTFWHTLTMYTTGESCSMCMSAIRFTVLKEVVYGTSIEFLHANGWPQSSLFNQDIQQATNQCNFGNDGTAMQTRVVKLVLNNETNPYFAWQFNPSAPCPTGCHRVPNGFPGCQ